MFGERLKNLRERSPLIHNITNFVTVNDCANILLACGASPIMATDRAEVEEITSRCDGLVLNMGTLRQSVIPSMLAAGKEASRRGIPVVLDPVGVGTSRLRTETAARLLEEVQVAVIRGNCSEIKALAVGSSSSQGVDAGETDKIKAEGLEEAVRLAKTLSLRTGAVVAATGAVDIVTDGSRTFLLRNGTSMLSKITGAGCMLSAMTAAYLAANPEEPLPAAAAAVCAMGLCGEEAYQKMAPGEGNFSFRGHLIDSVFCLTPEQLESGANYEVQ